MKYTDPIITPVLFVLGSLLFMFSSAIAVREGGGIVSILSLFSGILFYLGSVLMFLQQFKDTGESN